ncbi:CIC11C00000004236 [Sungouiella intermedia]|uniref:Defective in cullin neddylation protein n=1 Tax=Sungouiella intermedia TaxID=45354 RepID=A0A1L0DDV7_9ASCO|nr:CIC11C00000004236 [[Candida] intermedia]
MHTTSVTSSYYVLLRHGKYIQQAPKAELKSQFCSITNSLPAVATKYLEKHKWDLLQALQTFYNQPAQTAVPNKKVSKDLEAIFDKYKDPESPTIILIDGTLAYLEDLGFDPEDLVSLTLAYVLKSPQTGEFNRDVFLEVWSTLGISSIQGMKSHILAQHQSIADSPSEFEKFYQYVFDFVRGSDVRIKTIGYEDAVLYWKMLFSSRESLADALTMLNHWYTFIETNKRNISKDAWNMFYKFVIQVIVADPVNLTGYDEMSAWPSVVDEFMEWLQDNEILPPQ